MKRYADKKVFITGAASGIGRALAIAMGKAGSRLFLSDINPDGLKNVVEEITSTGGTVCLSRALDVSSYQDMKDFSQEIHNSYGSLDVLMNVAGVALFSEIQDMDHADWERIININLWGVAHGLELYVPKMIEAGKGGHILSLSSTAGIIGLPWHTAYAGTKHAIVGMSEVLRYDLRKHRINVSVACPGAVNTGLVETAKINTDVEGITDKAREIFRKITKSPDKIVASILRGMRRKKFLILMPFDIKLFYFVKKICFPLYHLVMILIGKILDKALKNK